MDSYVNFNSGAISASEAISQAWDLIKDNYWLFFGIVALGVVLLGCIPCVNIFLMGPFLVGVYFAYMTKMRGEPVTFDMLFKGFEKFVPAMILGLIESIPAIITYILRFSINLASLGLDINKRGGRGSFFAPADDLAPAIAGGLLLVILIVVIVFIIFAWAWRITFLFALPILTEYDLPPVECIKLSARAGWSNIGGIILLIILQGLLAVLGILALCIGWIFLMPIIVGSNFVAYRMVFPPKPSGGNQYNAPPTPDYYGESFGNAG